MTISKLFYRSILVLFFFSLIVTSCSKDDQVDGEGRFSPYTTCAVTEPPEGVSLDPFYAKYVNCSGIPVVGSNNVSELSLLRADSLIAFMLSDISEVRDKMISNGVYMVLVADGEDFSDLPEWDGMNLPTQYSAQYLSRKFVAATPEAALNCVTGSSFETDNVFMHEFVHAMHLAGFDDMYNGFTSELRTTYNNARSAGLWGNTYAGVNYTEYLAEGVNMWYNVQFPYGPVGGDGTNNNINTREELEAYDIGLYNFIAKYFNDEQARPPVCFWVPPSDYSVSCQSTVTDIDGNVYEVVSIGTKCWMKQNLNVTRFADGSSISEMQADADWATVSISAYCNYNNEVAKSDSFGKLYSWQAMTNTAGLCPNGWHVATFADWQELNLLVSDVFGLMTPHTWIGAIETTTDELGFSALPAGSRVNGNFEGIYTSTNFLIPDREVNAQEVDAVRLFSNYNYFQVTNVSKTTGSSCRCVKD